MNKFFLVKICPICGGTDCFDESWCYNCGDNVDEKYLKVIERSELENIIENIFHECANDECQKWIDVIHDKFKEMIKK